MIYQLDWNVVWKEEICLREMREEGGYSIEVLLEGEYGKGEGRLYG